MKHDPPSHPPGDDDFLLQELRRHTLRPPPADWRAAILSAAESSRMPARRSVFRRLPRAVAVMAALWLISLLLWLDTRRVESTMPSAHMSTMASAPLRLEDFQSFLAFQNSRTSALTKNQP